ncbi:esterase family protein [Nakamurella endophytica]|uniref:Esterase n=1 Tax=Nakamurella endophytica TaxID=1748367 RepID=A0A917WL43_9ACTN|nr:alpha/beta hydrolase-fold protein [Nakamurella endophytica]GGM12829.1 esterase [Nakamurella endophytica]
MTRTEYHWLDAPQLGSTGPVVVHGHWGRPVLWFPTECGESTDFERHGLLDAVRGAVDDGLITVVCVPSYDHASWSNRALPQGERARAHRRYEDWIIWHVVPFIRDRCGGRDDIAVAGPSMGAFHSVLFALRHAHVFRQAVAFSGAYDPWRWHAWGDADLDTYLTDPFEFLPGTDGGHLDFLRRTVDLTLVVGSGRWEDTTGAHASTRALAGVLAGKGIPHRLYVWGPEWPHDWPSWQAQAALYLPALG